MRVSFFSKKAQDVDTSTKEVVKPLNNPITIDITHLNPSIKNKNLALYNKILFALNSGIYFMTNGEVDFKKLKSTNFTIDMSRYTHPEVKSLYQLCQQFYQTIYGNIQLDSMIQVVNTMNDIKNKNLTNYIGQDLKPLLITLLNQAKRYEQYYLNSK